MFLNSRRKNEVEAQVDFSLKVTKRTRVTCFLDSVCTQIFSEFWRVGAVV